LDITEDDGLLRIGTEHLVVVVVVVVVVVGGGGNHFRIQSEKGRSKSN